MSSDSPKPSSGTKKKGGTKKGGTPKAAESNPNDAVVSLERKPELGMNPVGILTGYYGSRGERIRHTVHDGALKLPKDALDLLDEATEETGLAPAESYDLPGLDCVVRPSIDPALDTLIITDIALERVAVPDPSSPPPQVPEGAPPPEPKMVHVIRNKVENRTKERRSIVASSTNGLEPGSAERIRGGGEGGDGSSRMDVDSGPSAAPAAQAPTPDADEVVMDVDPEPVNYGAQAATAYGAATLSTTSDRPVVASQSYSNAPSNAPTNPAVFPLSTPAPTQSSTDGPLSTFASSGASAPPDAPVLMVQSTPAPQVAPVAQSMNPDNASGARSNSASPAPAAEEPTPKYMQPSFAAPAAKKTEASPAPAPHPVDTAQVMVTPAPAPPPTSAAPVPVPVTTSSSAPDPSKSAPVPPVPSKEQSSNGTIKVEEAPTVQTLGTKPEPRWELHRPGPNDEMVTPDDQLTPKPSWYRKDGVADIERVMLPEWFDGSASHRTPESYVKARETVLRISDTVSNRNVTSAMIRRSIVGDAGSLQRLRNFMSNWGLVNEDAINDSAPTAPVLRENYPVPKQFDEKLRGELVNAVVDQSNKRRKTAADHSFVPINWEEVALQVGNGATSADCERNFLSMPIHAESSEGVSSNPERPITPEVSHETQTAFSDPTKDAARQEFLRELVDSCSPAVVSKATEAALQAAKESANLKEAQSGAVLGLVASRAVEEAKETEKELESILSQLLDQRMKKLENRMAMMDDVESILEAEKVALELERRDLYTARCRHWFGGT